MQCSEKISISKEHFYIQRIDYCANIRLGSRHEAEECMRPVRKGLCPHPTTRKEEYGKTQGRWIPPRNSFTVYCGSYEFSVYDKRSQIMGEQRRKCQTCNETKSWYHMP